MKKILTTFLTIAILVVSVPFTAYGATTTYSLTVNASDVAATLSDYPSYVDLSEMPASFWSTVTTNTQTHSLDLESGSSQYASISDGSQTGLDITGDMTLEAWISPESLPSSGGIYTIASKSGASGQRGYIFFVWNDSGTYYLTLQVSDNGANNENLRVAYTPNTATWQPVAVTFDASASQAEFFANRSSIGTDTGTITSVFNNTSPFRVGAIATNALYFDGLIKDVRVFNDIRTADEIRADMQVQTVSDANLQGEWNFNNDYTDSSGNGNTLTPSGSPVFSSDVPFTNAGRDLRFYSDSALTTELAVDIVDVDTSAETGEVHVKIPSLTTSTKIYATVDGTSGEVRSTDTYGSEAVWSDYAGVWHLNEASGGASDSTSNANNLTDNNGVGSGTGQIGGAREFVAANTEFLDIADASQTGLDFGGDFRFTFLYKPTSQPSDGAQNIVGKGFSGSDRSYLVRYADSGGQKSIQVIVSSTGSNTEILEVDISNLSTSVFTKITANWDASTATAEFFVNGVSQGTDTGAFTSLFNNTESFAIGIQNPDGSQINPVDGLVDEMVAYQGLLSDDWELTEYNNQSDVAGFWTIAEAGGVNNVLFFFGGF